LPTKSYSWSIEPAPLSKIANLEKKLPKNFITKNGFGVTKKGIEYLQPLIEGEAKIAFKNGLPEIKKLKLELVKKKLEAWDI
jgi:6-phosphofructokinase 1